MNKFLLALFLTVPVFADVELTRTHDWTTDKDNNVKITASRMDTDSDETVAALNRKVQVKSTAPTTGDGYTWVDIGENPPIIKHYDSTNAVWAEALPIPQNSFDDYISGAWVSVASGGATINVGAGSIMINGKMTYNSTQIDHNPAVDPTTSDWMDIWALYDTTGVDFTISSVDSALTPGGTSNPGTNGRLIGSAYHDGSGVYSAVVNYRQNMVVGWFFLNGDGTRSISATFTHGVTFDDLPVAVVVGPLANLAGSEPDDIGKLVTEIEDSANYAANDVTTTTFLFVGKMDGGGEVFTSGSRYGYSFIIFGDYS